MNLKSFIVVLVFFLPVSGCERRTEVRLAGNPPSFILSGSGVLADLVVYGPESADRNNVMWEIKEEGLRGVLVEKLRSVTYGVIPAGYKQVVPENGEPLALVPGKKYRYWVVTGEAPGVIGYFAMWDEVPVAVRGPSECIEIRDDKIVPIRCPESIKEATSKSPRKCYEVRDNNEVVRIECPAE